MYILKLSGNNQYNVNLTEKTTFPALVFEKGFFRTQTQTLIIIPPKHLVFLYQMVQVPILEQIKTYAKVYPGREE